jgi:hypothetical protein
MFPDEMPKDTSPPEKEVLTTVDVRQSKWKGKGKLLSHETLVVYKAAG